MAGLIGVGRNTLGQASVGFQQTAGLESSRMAMADQLAAARAAQRSSMVSTGAGLGASVGANKLAAAGGIGAKAAAPVAAPVATAIPVAETIAVPISGPSALGTIEAGAMTSLGQTGTVSALPAAAETLAVAGETAGALAPEIATAATEGVTAAAGSSGATGVLGAVGTVATPLLIGAGAALLLDSLFDIF